MVRPSVHFSTCTYGCLLAWVMGAADPISGTVSLIEIIKGLGVLLKSGWRPLRNILIASWDAEEVSKPIMSVNDAYTDSRTVSTDSLAVQNGLKTSQSGSQATSSLTSTSVSFWFCVHSLCGGLTLLSRCIRRRLSMGCRGFTIPCAFNQQNS